MWNCLLFLGTVLSTPTDEFRSFVHEGELSINGDNLLKQIVPSGYIPQILGDRVLQLSNIFNKDNEYYTEFNSYVEKGSTMKGLIFNIYDDNMRKAAVALYRLLKDSWHKDKAVYEKLKKWAKFNINSDMLDYALRLTSLFSTHNTDEKFLPPFINKPNYFVNGETIFKALYVKQNLGKIDDDIMQTYQIKSVDENNIVINTNYSGWNIPLDACDKEIKYFTEDVALNSFYYGIHLLHPFWMPNEELNELNPRHAEHYYFAYQQLYARYLLEKEHLGPTSKKTDKSCESDFHPYLIYENGLPFPTRSSVIGENIRDNLSYLKMIDIAIKECLHRGLVIMENGTFLRVTEDNYIDLMTKLIRANLDGIKAAKVIRSIFGYGNNGYPIDKYNPSPSTMHHPQTTLRDPVFWFLIKRTLDYFVEYTNSTIPFNISDYETDEFVITNAVASKMVTSFNYFDINLHKSLDGDKLRYTSKLNANIFARQKRLNHIPFSINISLESKVEKDVIIKFFLGPQCSFSNCWDIYFKFVQLDSYRHKLIEGFNIISWTPQNSNKYSSPLRDSKKSKYEYEDLNYDIFKFPQNLILPKGLEVGLNMTVFVIILENDIQYEPNLNQTLYNKVYTEVDNKPLGFPFHKQCEMFSEYAPNYKFFNVSIFHVKDKIDNENFFSSFLY